MSLGGWQDVSGQYKCFILCARKITEGDVTRFVFLKDPLGCHGEHGLNKESKPEAQVGDHCGSLCSREKVGAKCILEVKLMGLALG